ncbi:hypothetical protein [Pseudoramibacter alactolyticus]|jgi:energy-coupling factor transport system permease protein|nr:hypothetical protein [Pseudoramibacter alactolyticus]
MLAFMLPKHHLRPIYAVGMFLLVALFGLGERKAAFKGSLPYMAVIGVLPVKRTVKNNK